MDPIIINVTSTLIMIFVTGAALVGLIRALRVCEVSINTVKNQEVKIKELLEELKESREKASHFEGVAGITTQQFKGTVEMMLGMNKEAGAVFEKVDNAIIGKFKDD